MDIMNYILLNIYVIKVLLIFFLPIAIWCGGYNKHTSVRKLSLIIRHANVSNCSSGPISWIRINKGRYGWYTIKQQSKCSKR